MVIYNHAVCKIGLTFPKSLVQMQKSKKTVKRDDAFLFILSYNVDVKFAEFLTEEKVNSYAKRKRDN